MGLSARLVNMGIIVAVFFFILDSFPKFIGCQEGVCNTRWDAKECCIDYRKVDNKCVLCQNGFYGSGCQTPCPFGFYGEACREECNCEDDQICDPKTGCAYNVTEVCPKGTYGFGCAKTCPEGYYGEDCRDHCKCRESQTCDRAYGCVDTVTEVFIRDPGTTEVVNTQETQTTYFSESQKNVIRLYIWSGLAGFIFVFSTVILLLRYSRKKRRWGENDQKGRISNRQIGLPIGKLQHRLPLEMPPLPSKHQELVPPDSDYAEILELEPDYLEPCAVSRVSEV